MSALKPICIRCGKTVDAVTVFGNCAACLSRSKSDATCVCRYGCGERLARQDVVIFNGRGVLRSHLPVAVAESMKGNLPNTWLSGGKEWLDQVFSRKGEP